MTEPAAADLLAAIRGLALEAGQVILGYYAEAVTAQTKADGSPVTLADQAAEAVILAGLRTLTPEVPVVAEEAVAAGQVPAVAGRFWLVDPLDGTKEFINRNGEFTVNIALIENGLPRLGVVLAPAPGVLYAGLVGVGAWSWSAAGAGVEIAARVPPAAGWVALGSRSHGGGAAEDAFVARYPVTERRAAGSSLKFCEIARGAADLYVRAGRTCEWDTAAGQAVLMAAGGRVEDLDGAPFVYGKAGFFNPGFAAFGRREQR
jgi:3'(2'), 5'-bisphosphate nucleotidase